MSLFPTHAHTPRTHSHTPICKQLQSWKGRGCWCGVGHRRVGRTRVPPGSLELSASSRRASGLCRERPLRPRGLQAVGPPPAQRPRALAVAVLRACKARSVGPALLAGVPISVWHFTGPRRLPIAATVISTADHGSVHSRPLRVGRWTRPRGRCGQEDGPVPAATAGRKMDTSLRRCKSEDGHVAAAEPAVPSPPPAEPLGAEDSERAGGG